MTREGQVTEPRGREGGKKKTKKKQKETERKKENHMEKTKETNKTKQTTPKTVNARSMSSSSKQQVVVLNRGVKF